MSCTGRPHAQPSSSCAHDGRRGGRRLDLCPDAGRCAGAARRALHRGGHRAAAFGDVRPPAARAPAPGPGAPAVPTGVDAGPDLDVARTGGWLLELAAQVRPDVVHLNGYAHAALPFGVPVARGGALVRLLVVPRGARWPRRPSGDEYRRRVARRAAGGHAPSSRRPRRCALRSSLDARLRRRADRRTGAGAPSSGGGAGERSRSSSRRAGCGTKPRASPCSTRRAPARPGRSASPARSAPAPTAPSMRRAAARRSASSPPTRCRVDGPGRASSRCPARYEPFGLSPLEAALAGCALVLGDIPSLREVWGDAALYVRPDDPDALRQAIAALAGDRRRRDASARRRRGAPPSSRANAPGASTMAGSTGSSPTGAPVTARAGGGLRAHRALLPLAGLRLEPRQRAFPARRRRELLARGHDVARLRAGRRLERRRTCVARARRRPRSTAFRARLPGAAQHALRPGDARSRRGARRRRPRASSTSGTTTTLVARIGEHRRAGGALRAAVPRHAPPLGHRARRDGRLRSRATTTACSRSATSIRDLLPASAAGRSDAWTWHEAADIRVFHPLPRRSRAKATSSGSATGATTSAPRELARVPARAGARRSACGPRVHGVRYPARRAGARSPTPASSYARLAAELRRAGGVRAPSRSRCTCRAGPTSRRCPASRRSACSRRWPAASRWSARPWDDGEGLFAPATDYLVARDGARDGAQLRARAATTERSPRARRRTGCATILARHTCAHRVDELLAIYAELGRRRTGRAHRDGSTHDASTEHRVLRLEPRVGLLERRGHLLPRHRARARTSAATASPSTSPTPTSGSSTATSPIRRGRGSSSIAATGRRRCDACVERARRPTSSSRRAASACSTSCSSGGARRSRRRHAGRVLGRRRAGHARSRARRPGRSVPRAGPALRPGPHLRRRRAGASTPTRRSARATACRSTTRSIPSTHHPVAPDAALRGDLALPRQPPARSRGARRGVLPARRARSCPTARFLLGGSGWARQAACRPTCATSATSTRATTTRSTARRWRCSTSAATAWRATASRRRRACSRRPAPARA